MQFKYTDYNGASDLLGPVWPEIEKSISEMPLFVKGSDQAGIQGSLIFDPVGSNKYIKDKLESLGWFPNVPIPHAYSSLGTDIDFEKNGVILEVQFSNYPFLLNNIVRSYLFSKQAVLFNGSAPKVLIIITKCKIFPASNSTLYYEQGLDQLDALAKFDVFDLPIRLVGLSEKVGEKVPCIFKTYSALRYSRTIAEIQKTFCHIEINGARAKLRLDSSNQASNNPS